MSDIVIGIDLGTTNSAVATFVEGNVRLLGPEGGQLLPSVVGLSPDGSLLVGTEARNQLVPYPERTIRSIKRRMGSGDTVSLDGRDYTPAEISSLILRELASRAGRQLGRPIRKAVITVPAYFSDAQRQATREAGVLAGLEVLHILNEPTAASFAYGYGMEDDSPHHVVVYDLGGGTFDISVVRIEAGVTEVLATTGDNHLGGDDFDELLRAHLAERFEEQTGIRLDKDRHPRAWARLLWAAEEAKIRLSTETRLTIREEALVEEAGLLHNLEVTLARSDFEELISELLKRTVSLTTEAIEESSVPRDSIDAVLLVGGSTRTPLVRDLLEEELGLEIREDVHPDLAVALGAGVQASRMAGHGIDKVLVDITPYSFGIAHLEERNGISLPDRYRPTILKNSPIPNRRSRTYYTAAPFQTEIEIDIYQGESHNAKENIFLGTFMVVDLTPSPKPVSIQLSMSLDTNGILTVTAREEATGKQKGITINNALKSLSDEEVAEARKRMEALFARRADTEDHEPEEVPLEEPSGKATTALDEEDPAAREARALLDKTAELAGDMDEEDRREMEEYRGIILKGIAAADQETVQEAIAALREMTYYLEHR